MPSTSKSCARAEYEAHSNSNSRIEVRKVLLRFLICVLIALWLPQCPPEAASSYKNENVGALSVYLLLGIVKGPITNKQSIPRHALSWHPM